MLVEIVLYLYFWTVTQIEPSVPHIFFAQGKGTFAQIKKSQGTTRQSLKKEKEQRGKIQLSPSSLTFPHSLFLYFFTYPMANKEADS